jgi:hypothetical protein
MGEFFGRAFTDATACVLRVHQVPFLLGIPGEEDLAPFVQDARAASVLCATTGELREGYVRLFICQIASGTVLG